MPLPDLNARLAQALYEHDTAQVLALLTPGPELTEDERPARIRLALDAAFGYRDLPMVEALAKALLAVAPAHDPVWRQVLHQPIFAADPAGLAHLLALTAWPETAYPAAMAEALMAGHPTMALTLVERLGQDHTDTVLAAAVMTGHADWVERCLDLGHGNGLHKALWDTLRPHGETAQRTWAMMEESLAGLPITLVRRLVAQDQRWPALTVARYPHVMTRARAEDRQADLEARPSSPPSSTRSRRRS